MTTIYTVHKGRVPGIYTTWAECKKQIDKFDGAIYKKFNNKDEAKAFLENGFGNKKPKIITRRENDDIKNNTKIKNEEEDETDKIFIYTDGSCIQFKIAGYGIYIPEKSIKVAKPLLNQKITNNRAELMGIIESVDYLDANDLLKKICIFTDSQYCMYIFNGTGERYEKDGFKNNGKDVPNIDLIKKILNLKRTHNIILLKVRAHTDKKDKHSIGNEIADKLATEGAYLSNPNNELLKSVSKPVPKKDISSNIFIFNKESDDQSQLKESSRQDIIYDSDEDITNKIQCVNIDKNIQMNELFDFEESKSKPKSKSKPSNKNQKLSDWFIKV